VYSLEAGQFAPENVIICSNTMRLDLDKISENLAHKEVIKYQNNDL
jgi:3-hydroxyacyl-CoA dehydrogenase